MRTGIRRLLVLLSIAAIGVLAWVRMTNDSGQRSRSHTPAQQALTSLADPVPGTELVNGWPKRIKRRRDGAIMVLIPAGTFWMGRTHEQDPEIYETPRHEVQLTQAFYMDQTEVTVGQWKRFAAEMSDIRPKDLAGPDDLPVEGIHHKEAVEYAAWVQCALPTEAQWEWAARGGARDWRYPWGDEDEVRMRNGGDNDDGYVGRAPVAAFPPNGYGLYDMSGNVWEWCSDWFRRWYYSKSPRVNPKGPDSGFTRSHTIRGGGYYSGKSKLTVSYREGRSDFLLDFVGFRLVRVID